VDVLNTAPGEHEVFNVVATTILERIGEGAAPTQAVSATLNRWRRFWAAVPEAGLSAEEARGLFGELWFLATWLLPRGHEQVRHWLGPTGTRHDFQWRNLAVEAKATTSVRGHVHRINGVDQLDPPVGGELRVFSLRIREEPTAANSLATLVEHVGNELRDEDLLDVFETRLGQAGYSPINVDRYSETRYRIVNERLYNVGESFPRLSAASFAGGLEAAIERIEYDINLDGCPQLILATASVEFSPPDEPEGVHA
jgi:hypothetical protein